MSSTLQTIKTPHRKLVRLITRPHLRSRHRISQELQITRRARLRLLHDSRHSRIKVTYPSRSPQIIRTYRAFKQLHRRFKTSSNLAWQGALVAPAPEVVHSLLTITISSRKRPNANVNVRLPQELSVSNKWLPIEGKKLTDLYSKKWNVKER